MVGLTLAGSKKGKMSQMSFVAFTNANSIGDRFLALLSNHGIQPPLGSSLEDELLSLTQLIEVMKNPSLAQGGNEVTILRAAAGLHDFAAKVLSVEPLREFTTFLPHLRLIAATKVAAASLAQNTPGAQNDDTARKMAELYMGCLAAHVGTQVVLDSPTNAKGDNPDVIFTVEECFVVKRPQRRALAIKTISSRESLRSETRWCLRAEKRRRSLRHPASGTQVASACLPVNCYPARSSTLRKG